MELKTGAPLPINPLSIFSSVFVLYSASFLCFCHSVRSLRPIIYLHWLSSLSLCTLWGCESTVCVLWWEETCKWRKRVFVWVKMEWDELSKRCAGEHDNLKYGTCQEALAHLSPDNVSRLIHQELKNRTNFKGESRESRRCHIFILWPNGVSLRRTSVLRSLPCEPKLQQGRQCTEGNETGSTQE